MSTKNEYKKTIESFQSQKNHASLLELGLYLINNKDGEENETLAAYAFECAIAAGSTEALYELGMCYRWGDGGVYADPEEALKYFRLAKDAGDSRASSLIEAFDSEDGKSMMLLSAISGAEGQGTKWYKAKASVDMYIDMAENGNAEAQYELARQLENIHRYGPFKYDIERAVYWYERAARSGVVDAMYNLSMIYKNGKPGLDPDAEKAKYWMQKCADAGDEEAKQLLAKMRWI